MPDISSASNAKIKSIKRLLADKKYRSREASYVVEGTRWMSEVAQSGDHLKFWIATEEWLTKNQGLANNITEQNSSPITVEPQILKQIADTETPSGVLAVLNQPNISWPINPTFLLLLDQIKDPGNMGTLIRSALAAGVDGIIQGPGCVDPFNPKVVRSSMGAIMRLPIRQTTWKDGAHLWGNCKIYLADADGEIAYTDADWKVPAAIMIGGEADGASLEAKELVHHMISIPMAQDSESLNAGVAGSIILFEARRQHSV